MEHDSIWSLQPAMSVVVVVVVVAVVVVGFSVVGFVVVVEVAPPHIPQVFLQFCL